MNASVTRLGDVTLNFNSRRRPVKGTEREPGPYPYYGASGIVDSVADYIFDGEYLLIAEDGENLRTRNTPVAFMARGKFWANNHAHVVQGNDLADTRYLCYLLSITDIAAYLTGSTQPKLTRSALDSIVLPIPPISEQRAIAEVLGALDDKIATNTQLADSAEQLASQIYLSLSHRALVSPMSDVLTPVLGGTPARNRTEFWGGNDLWISAKDVTGAPNRVVFDTEEKITSVAVSSTKAKPLPAGSVILTARGTVGAVARLAVASSFNQSCYGFTPGRLPKSVLYFAILGIVDQAKSLAHGSVFDTITMKTFDHVSVPTPDSPWITEAETRIQPLLGIVSGAVAEKRTLAATRDALLPQLMSGRLRVKDAETIVAAAV